MAETAVLSGRQGDAHEVERGARAAPALEVLGLSHSFGQRKALDEVGFAIPRSSFTVLLGQNGAGKTTLFNLITRLYSNRSGSIRILGIDVRARPSQALAELGVVFQQRTIDLDLTVMQNLLYAAGLQGLARKLAKERAAAELARFELAERARDKVRQLSGGQLRRVEIARALLHRPQLLLLDEPTVGLDIGSRQAILEHVRGLCVEAGIGVLWATHLIDEVQASDQVIVLHQGRILAQGDGAAICAKAKASDLRGAFTKLTAAEARAA
jgi:ABC-2 type transport system ATP-binding protein